MPRKGQMEPIVLLGLIFISVVVIYFTYQALTYTTDDTSIGIGEEQKALRKPVEDLIRVAASEALREMEFDGGYSIYGSPDPNNPPQIPTTKFMGYDVKYWSAAEIAGDLIPDFDAEIVPSFKRYIRRFIEERAEDLIGTSYRDAQVDIDELDVVVEFTNDNMMVMVNLPVTVEDYSLSPRYIVNMPTRFKYIYDFAKDFSEDQARERNLDRFTIASILFSPYLATGGMLTSCGDMILQTQEDTSRGLENAAYYTLLNTFFWTTRDEHDALHERNLYYIPEVNDNSYDLAPMLSFPDDFHITTYADPLMVFNTEWVAAFIPVCLTGYQFTYEILYPYIVTVEDELSGNRFNFAGMVYVHPNENALETGEPNEGMIPGDYDQISVESYGEMGSAQDCVCEPAKYAEVYLEYSDGEPVTDAKASLGPCPLSHVEDGHYKGEMYCGFNGNLMIYRDGYNYIQDYKEISQGDDAVFHYTLRRKPSINLVFHEVELRDYKNISGTMTDVGVCGSMIAESGDRVECIVREPRSMVTTEIVNGGGGKIPVPPNINGEKVLDCTTLFDQDAFINDVEDCGCSTWSSFWGTCDEGDVYDCVMDEFDDYYIPVGDCMMDGGLDNEITVDYINGHADYTFNILSRTVYGFDANGGMLHGYNIGEEDMDLHVYVPVTKWDMKRFNGISDDEKICLVNFMLGECGLEPLSEEPVSYTEIIDGVPQ